MRAQDVCSPHFDEAVAVAAVTACGHKMMADVLLDQVCAQVVLPSPGLSSSALVPF